MTSWWRLCCPVIVHPQWPCGGLSALRLEGSSVENRFHTPSRATTNGPLITRIHLWKDLPSKAPDVMKYENVSTSSQLQQTAVRLKPQWRGQARRNSVTMQVNCWSSCPGGRSQTLVKMKMLNRKVRGWCGYMFMAVKPTGCIANFLKIKNKNIFKWGTQAIKKISGFG